jgi:valyl-tRNA synthetase
VSLIRNARADAGIDPASLLVAELHFDDPEQAATFEAISDVMARLARVQPNVVAAPASVTDDRGLVVVSRGIEVKLLASADDRERDRGRLQRELAEAEGRLAATHAKLANEAFVDKAPAHVVAGVRATATELQDLAERIREHLAR